MAGPRGYSRGVEIDWSKWVRHIESRRRKLALAARPLPGTMQSIADATLASFCLDGLNVALADVNAALATGVNRRVFRARQSQRVRNHVAIIRSLDRSLARQFPLRSEHVLRWYTSISSGLSMTHLNTAASDRLQQVVDRMNSTELRPQAGIQQVARVHAQLMSEPLVPSFNGILARLLLRYHLGRCGLPPVLFHSQTPVQAMTNSNVLLPLLLELLEESYEALLKPKK